MKTSLLVSSSDCYLGFASASSNSTKIPSNSETAMLSMDMFVKISIFSPSERTVFKELFQEESMSSIDD